MTLGYSYPTLKIKKPVQSGALTLNECGRRFMRALCHRRDDVVIGQVATTKASSMHGYPQSDSCWTVHLLVSLRHNSLVVLVAVVLLLMDKILHDPKEPKLYGNYGIFLIMRVMQDFDHQQ